MAFEVFTRKSSRSGKEARIAISKMGTFHLNTVCMNRYLEDVELVQLMYDSAERRIAFKPASDGDEHTYKLTQGNAGGGHVSGSGFLHFYNIDHDKTKSCLAEWIDDLGAIVIDLEKKK